MTFSCLFKLLISKSNLSSHYFLAEFAKTHPFYHHDTDLTQSMPPALPTSHGTPASFFALADACADTPDQT